MRTFFVMDVENRRGVLERIASVLRRRMLQIETIVAAPTRDPARAVITFVVDTDDYGIQRISDIVNCYYLTRFAEIRVEVVNAPAIADLARAVDYGGLRTVA